MINDIKNLKKERIIIKLIIKRSSILKTLLNIIINCILNIYNIVENNVCPVVYMH